MFNLFIRLSCARKVLANEGLRGLYRGLSANLIGVTPEKAIKLAVNDYARAYFGKRLNMAPEMIPAFYGMAAGAIAGFCQVIATNPMEIVKIQMQLASREPASFPGAKSLISVVKRLGFAGLYRGTVATLSRDIPFSILFFQSFASLKQVFILTLSNHEGPHLLPSLTAGMLAGGISAFVATPMDGIMHTLECF